MRIRLTLAERQAAMRRRCEQQIVTRHTLNDLSAAELRYSRYIQRCECIYVRPFSFDLWRQIEPWLIEKGRIAVLEVLRSEMLQRELSDSFSQATIAS